MDKYKFVYLATTLENAVGNIKFDLIPDNLIPGTMTYIKKYYFITALWACLCNRSYSQSASLPDEETKLLRLYTAVINRPGNSDSASYYSDKFGEELKEYIATTPSTLEYSFKRLTDCNYCFISTSLDGNLRIYSWDTWTGGTMHFYNQITQYRDNGLVFTKISQYEEGDPGAFCSAIYTVIIKDASFYLPISNGTYSTKDASQYNTPHFQDQRARLLS